jgi:GH15 family glucan-1,4-alpha-glucosidase
VSDTPIADYALLSDCHSAALVDRAGSVDWLCWPRFDGPAVHARLLDERAGHWSLALDQVEETTRRYLHETMVLESTAVTATGTARLIEAMIVGRNERGHELGRGSPHALARTVECLEGTVTLSCHFSPRPEYGLIYPIFNRVEGGVSARGGADVMSLSSPVELELDDSIAAARLTLRRGEKRSFVLQHRPSWEPPPGIWSQDEIEGRLRDTVTAWRTWSALHQGYEGPWRQLVRDSGRVLQALTFAPTGAIIAGATTSLPESVGGTRNWDYRYAWVRDASLTLEALWVAACPDEAHDFFAWMAGAAAASVGRGSDLQIMFGVGGEHDLSERELPHLAGWRHSRPVRVGNGAWDQRQLDVYGELLNAAHRLADQLDGMEEGTRLFLRDAADAAADRWREPDQGIWEIRGDPQHFLYSKLMCWVALDRALGLADLLGARDRVDRWRREREEIAAAIGSEGWSDRAGAFSQALGSDELDASALMLPIVGFLPGSDPRMIATIAAIEERLTDDHGLVYRYRAHDGLEGEEGTFLLCTFWLAQAQALAGQSQKARATFERASSFANDLGLLAEEVDPATRELLGNFPQAFSHIGLINAAWAISETERSSDETSPGRQARA